MTIARRIMRRLAALLTPRRLAAWGGGLLFLTVFFYVHAMSTAGYIDRVGRFKGADYIQFYVMGSMLLDGRPEVLFDGRAHLAEGRRRIDPALKFYAGHPNYGPQVAAAFMPLARLPFGWSLAVFLGLMAAAYGVAVWLLWRDCEGLRDYGRLVALLAAASPVFWSAIRYGQLSPATLLLVALALAALRRGRWYLSGLVIGSLAFKPQLGLVIGVVLVFGREWRIVAGAVTAVGAQVLLGLAIAGRAAMAQYVGVLWTLLLDPSLVQQHPSEVHSVRGFVQLLSDSPAMVSVCFWASVPVILAVAHRTWQRKPCVAFGWGQLMLLTILAAPHLLTYDLILLTVPLLACADWCVRHRDDPRCPAVALLLAGVYLAPFSSIVARLVPLQVSVVAFVVLAGTLYRVAQSEPERARVGVPGLEAELPSTS